MHPTVLDERPTGALSYAEVRRYRQIIEREQDATALSAIVTDLRTHLCVMPSDGLANYLIGYASGLLAARTRPLLRQDTTDGPGADSNDEMTGSDRSGGPAAA